MVLVTIIKWWINLLTNGVGFMHRKWYVYNKKKGVQVKTMNLKWKYINIHRKNMKKCGEERRKEIWKNKGKCQNKWVYILRKMPFVWKFLYRLLILNHWTINLVTSNYFSIRVSYTHHPITIRKLDIKIGILFSTEIERRWWIFCWSG
jgi:hypothetical protein